MNDDEMIRVVKLPPELADGQHTAIATPENIDFSVVRTIFLECPIGSSFEIEVDEMTQEEFENLDPI